MAAGQGNNLNQNQPGTENQITQGSGDSSKDRDQPNLNETEEPTHIVGIDMQQQHFTDERDNLLPNPVTNAGTDTLSAERGIFLPNSVPHVLEEVPLELQKSNRIGVLCDEDSDSIETILMRLSMVSLVVFPFLLITNFQIQVLIQLG